MNVSFDSVKVQLVRGIFPHAVLLSGSDAKAKERVIREVAEYFLGVGYTAHPDFFEIVAHPISIEVAASIKDRATRTPIAAPTTQTIPSKKIFLLRSLEALTRDAAPSLLKTLEDPGEHNIFIATTERFRSILPTIRSRFSHLHFSDATMSPRYDIDALHAMPYHKQFAVIPSLIEKGQFGNFINASLFRARAHVRKETTPQAIERFERVLHASILLEDPTVNKRLIGEYIMMVL